MELSTGGILLMILSWTAIVALNVFCFLSGAQEKVMIRAVASEDLSAWALLAKEVEPLFGKMVGVPAFEEGMRLAVKEKSAFCATDPESGDVVGAIAIDRDGNSIEWLAVSNRARGLGFGTLLLEKALGELALNRVVKVQTFAPEVAAGIPARKLYQKFGFVDVEYAGKNPAGIDTVWMEKLGKR